MRVCCSGDNSRADGRTCARVISSDLLEYRCMYSEESRFVIKYCIRVVGIYECNLTGGRLAAYLIYVTKNLFFYEY